VAKCDKKTDLVVAGGCSADPMWLALLINSKPFGMTDPRVLAGWRCDYRNSSEETSVEIQAEVYCARKNE
jgi:hypothetical protein